MTEYFVRPDSSHNTTRDGLTYGTAWGGWSEVLWGGSKVKAGDTLYICGAHTYTAQLNIGAHGATSDNRVTIRGDHESGPGSITFPVGSYFLLVNRDYTTFKNLTISAGSLYCLYLYGVAVTGITVQGCTLNGGTGQPMINMSGGNTLNYIDITIDDNDFIGGSGSPFGSAISWFVEKGATPETSPLSTLTRITITNNSFTNCASNRSVIEFLIRDLGNVGTKMADIVVTGNTFSNCIGVAISLNGPFVYGRNTGIRLTDNVMSDMSVVGIIGGGMSIGGFGPSLDGNFGPNVIARNRGYRLEGPTGLINVFYGTYVIYNNYAEDLTTETIDGSGILFDHGCKDCEAYSNHFKRLDGVPGVFYSGNGVTILDATNIKVYSNVFEEVYCGIHLGNKNVGQSSDIYNNTFKNCDRGVDILSTADMTNNLVRNNTFTRKIGSTERAVNIQSGGPWTGEHNNCFYGFAVPTGHTLHATTITTDPQLDERYGCASNAVRGKGVFVEARTDFYNRPFQNPPIIGAVEDINKDLYRTLKGI